MNLIDKPPIVQMPSPNIYPSRGAYAVRAIVCHAQQGFETGTDATFLNKASQSSSDYSVARTPPLGSAGPFAEIHQYVPHGSVSWAVGLPANCLSKTIKSNPALPSISVPVPNPNYPKWPLYVEGSNPNWYTKSIEFAGFGCPTTYGTVTYPATDWTDAQYESGAWLIAMEAARCGFPIDKLHVVRHGDIYTAKNHKCPGDLFDMDRIIKRALEFAA